MSKGVQEQEKVREPIYQFGVFRFAPLEGLTRLDGGRVLLTPKALDVLALLLQQHPRIVPKEVLLKRVWPNTFVEEHTLAQTVFTLRKALGETPEGHSCIETVPRVGYRFVAPVTTFEKPPVSEDKESQQPATATRHLLAWAGLALVVILITLITAGLYFRARSRAPASRFTAIKITLAVLPFQNLTSDPNQEYFSDGLTEEMITQLGGLSPEGLGVIARTSAMHYKGTTETAAQIGQELGVDYLVEGSLRREGSRVRISAQLIRVRDQMHLWARDYDSDFSDYLALESDVARDIVAQVQLKLSPAPAGRATRPLNLNAYDAYLKGRYFWNKRTEEGHLKAIECFNQAISADPAYVQAYSGLADAYALLGSNPTTAITRPEAMAKARSAALKALSLDETLAEAHTSLAFIYWHYDWNWPAAEKEFHRALQLNPSYATAHHWYAYYLLSQDRTDQALGEIRRAQETDPLSLIINADGAEILCLTRHYDQAIAQAKKTREMDPEFASARRTLVWSYLAKHEFREAVEEAKKGLRGPGANPDAEATLAIAYALAGQKAQARELLLKLKGESEKLHTTQLSSAIANVYAVLGEKDQAFAWLEKVLQQRDGGLTLIKLVPYLDSLRGDPRFADLVRRIGLPP